MVPGLLGTLRKEDGDERIRHLDYGVVLPAVFLICPYAGNFFKMVERQM